MPAFWPRTHDIRKIAASCLVVRTILDAATEDIESGVFADQPDVEALVRTTIGVTYWKLAVRDLAEQHLRVFWSSDFKTPESAASLRP